MGVRLLGLSERQKKEGFGDGVSIINLIWVSFWAQIMFGDEFGSNMEQL